MGNLTIQKEKTLSYSKIRAMKAEQDKLIAEGKIEKPELIQKEFSPKQEYEFRTGKTFDEIIKTYNLL